MKFSQLIAIPGGLILGATLLHGQSAPTGGGSFSTTFSGSFVGAGELELNGVKSGEVKTRSFNWKASYEHPFGEALSFTLGAGYEHFSVDYNRIGSPIPETLTAAFMELGVQWKYGDRWVFSASLEPGLYGDDEVDSSDAFTVPALLLATWIKDKNLMVSFGAKVSPFSDNVVMPVAAIRWAYNDDWTFVFGVPRTEARYRFNERLTFFGGAGFAGGTYAVDDPAVVGPPGRSLRNTKLSISEIRGLVGVDYDFTPRLNLSLEGGYTFIREFDYHERDVEYEADAAASASLSLRFSF